MNKILTQKIKNMENDFEVFIENLANEIGRGQDLEFLVLQEIKLDLTNSAESIINRKIINSLSSEKLEEFSSMLDQDLSDEVYQSFLATNIENMDEIVLNALLELKSKYIKPGIG